MRACTHTYTHAHICVGHAKIYGTHQNVCICMLRYTSTYIEKCLLRYTSVFRQRVIQRTVFVCMWMCAVIHIWTHVDVFVKVHIKISGTVDSGDYVRVHVDVYLNTHIKTCWCVPQYTCTHAYQLIPMCTRICACVTSRNIQVRTGDWGHYCGLHLDVYLNTHVNTCWCVSKYTYHHMHSSTFWCELSYPLACRNIQVGTGD